MCFFCNHESKGGYENTAIGTWSKGISLIFCSFIFLSHFVNENEFSISKGVPQGEYKMIYYLNICNLIGGLFLLLFSILGHFIYKPLLRPIYLSSFIVSLFLFSSGVYTTSLSKNISLKVIGIMDALKFHPDYMLINKINIFCGNTDVIVSDNDSSSNDGPLLSRNAPTDDVNSPNDEVDNPTDEVGNSSSSFDASKILDMINNRHSLLEKKKEMLLKALSKDELMNIFKNINVSDEHFYKENLENTILEIYDKIINIRFNFDIYDKFYKYTENNAAAFIKNSEKIKIFTNNFQKIINSHRKSLFNSLKYELVKYDNNFIKIYLNSIDKIKAVNKNNKNAKLDEYIDDLKRRNILIITTILLLMSFIYIHKGATLTTKSSMSITLM